MKFARIKLVLFAHVNAALVYVKLLSYQRLTKNYVGLLRDYMLVIHAISHFRRLHSIKETFSIEVFVCMTENIAVPYSKDRV